jgi:DNA-binding transcriptional LysR family regulator
LSEHYGVARMNFDLAELRAFVAVAELRSFHAAAEALHLSQSALSRRIGKLENALGVRLFDRTTRHVSLTAVGRDFSHKARSLIDDLEGYLLGIRELAATRMGELTVACVPSAVQYFLPPALRRYHARYPNIRVRIVGEGATEVLTTVVRGEAEFGLNYIGAQEPEIEFVPILREPFVLVCRQDHPLARRRAVNWAELGDFTFITVAKASGNRLVMDLALAGLSVRPNWFYEVRHVSMLPPLVEAGLGVAVVPRLAMPLGAHPTLASVSLAEPAVTRTLGLISKRGRELSPPARQLYALIDGGERRSREDLQELTGAEFLTPRGGLKEIAGEPS